MTSAATDAKGRSILKPVKGSESSLFWLGAGFSRCLTPNAPLMNDFFVGFDGAKYPHLAKYLSGRHEKVVGVNVEDVLLVIDQIENSPLPARARGEMMCGQNPEKVKHELQRFCLERLSFDVPNYRHWAVNILASANELTTVVTTNYDVLADKILRIREHITHCGPDATCHHCNMRAILENNCACGVPGQQVATPKNAALLKIHGSIAWRTCRNKVCGITDCLKSNCDCSPIRDPMCECCGEAADPVIVLPSAHKSFERYRQIERMWSIANDALATAVSITIFGFSFPNSDVLIRDMFRSAIARFRNLREMFIIDVDPESVWERIHAVMPRNLEFDLHLLPVPLDGSKPEWVE